MEWLITLAVAVIGVGGTLSGGFIGNRSAERRAAAERQERLETERARIEREEGAADKQEAAALRIEAMSLAEQVVEELTRDLEDVRAFREIDDDGFRTWFESEWRASKEIALRRVVGRVRDDDQRDLLAEVIDALAVQSEFTLWNTTRTSRKFVEDVLLLGLDSAMTMERGQVPGADIIMRSAELAKRIGEWQHYIAVKEASEWEEARRAFKLEELRWEADLEAAQEAQEEYEQEMAEHARWEEEAAFETREAARGTEELAHTFDDELTYQEAIDIEASDGARGLLHE